MTARRHSATGIALAVGVIAALIVPAAARADQVRDLEWWLPKLRIGEAQAITRGDGVVVGVLDSPVDGNHPALAGKVLHGKGASAGDPADGWGTGPKAEHGTGMAGLIAGEAPGGHGFIGVAPGARILPFASASSSDGDLAAGIKWLTDNGAKVINLSISGRGIATTAEVEAVSYALKRDVVVVAGAGNVKQTGQAVGSPANIPGVVAVSGVDQEGLAWNHSSIGPEVVLAAPAVEIPQSIPADVDSKGYWVANGTSSATAIVSGVAALIRAKYPKLNAPSVIERLIRTAREKGAPGRDSLYGYGTVRPFEALMANVPEVKTSSLGSPVVDTPPTSSHSVGETKSKGTGTVLVLAVVGVGGLLLVGLIVLVIALARRKPKPPQSGYPPHGGYPPPGWQGAPPGGPPQQYAPPQGQQHWPSDPSNTPHGHQ